MAAGSGSAPDGPDPHPSSGSAMGPPGHGPHAHWVLTTESGTGRFAGARGTVTFDGVMLDPTDSFTVSGVIQFPA